jgi:hypothetical protein
VRWSSEKIVTLLVRWRKAYNGAVTVEGQSYGLELGKVAIEEMVGSFLYYEGL